MPKRHSKRWKSAVAALGAVAAMLPEISAAQTHGTSGVWHCQNLGAVARALPASAWSKGFRALAPQLSITKWSTPETAFERQLADLPIVTDALSAAKGEATAQPLSPDVYVAENVGGTLECESIVVVKAPPGKAASLIASPPSFSDLCWTDGAAPGRLFGQPAVIETSDFADPGADERHLEVTPWTGAGWERSCRLSLTFKLAFTVTERFCGDAKVCAAAAPLASAIAAAHGGADGQSPFAFGPPPGLKGAALFKPFAGFQADAIDTPAFSTFGAKARTRFTTYAYNNLDLFPLTLRGTTYIGAVGYGGVGWRKIGDTLVAVYAAKGDQLIPLASFVVVRSVTGLASAKVETPKPQDDR